MTGLQVAFTFVFIFLVPTFCTVMMLAFKQQKRHQEIAGRLQQFEEQIATQTALINKIADLKKTS
ncbi:MAG: hypothetical protein ACYTFW_04200 [Planctomycetota bacterium]|jgi:preprotein translocase subunit YajC